MQKRAGLFTELLRVKFHSEGIPLATRTLRLVWELLPALLHFQEIFLTTRTFSLVSGKLKVKTTRFNLRIAFLDRLSLPVAYLDMAH